MEIVPDAPEPLLTEFLPSLFEKLSPSPSASSSAARPNPPRARPPAPAGVLVRVTGAGEWTLRFSDERLVVSAGSAADVALQITLAGRDFGVLVVDPLRAALAAGLAEGAAANGFWSRLGRWDAETVDLLRRQTGRILVRIQDQNELRNVALTPDSQPYSLETAECTIDCALSDLLALQAKRKSPLDLFYSGQLRIGGDAQVALAMAGLFL